MSQDETGGKNKILLHGFCVLISFNKRSKKKIFNWIWVTLMSSVFKHCM